MATIQFKSTDNFNLKLIKYRAITFNIIVEHVQVNCKKGMSYLTSSKHGTIFCAGHSGTIYFDNFKETTILLSATRYFLHTASNLQSSGIKDYK